MKPIPILLAAFFAAHFLTATTARAAAVTAEGLYQAQTEVADKTEPTRVVAVREALGLALVKLTGDGAAAAQPAAREILENALLYVQQFSYRQSEEEAAAPAAAPRLILHVRFDPVTLTEDMRAAGLSLWSKERPSILIWLLAERDRRRFVAGSETTPEWIEALQKRAAARGIGLILPLMDLQDSGATQTADLWGGVAAPVRAASRRYNPDIILTGNASLSPGGMWESTWVAYTDEAVPWVWTTESPLPELALEEGLDTLVDALARKYISDGALTRFELSVTNVASAARYAKLLRYLQSLSAVTDLDVVEVREDRVTLSLTAHGGDRAVAQAIGLGRVIRRPTIGTPLNLYEMLP